MNISLEQIKDLGPCEEGLAWYREHGTNDLEETLILVNQKHPDWARWLYTRLMSVSQRRQLAIFAAEQVLPIFEDKYPKDDRPRLAIEAAKAALRGSSTLTISVATAAYAAAATATAAYATAAAYAAVATAYAAATAAAYAEDAYAYAEDAYAAAEDAYAAADSRKKMQTKLIRYAVKLLDKENI